MSQFAIASPLPGEPYVTDAPSTPPEAPAWLHVATSALTCVLPCVLVLGYWAGRTRCDRVVNWSVAGAIAAGVMALAWVVVAQRGRGAGA